MNLYVIACTPYSMIHLFRFAFRSICLVKRSRTFDSSFCYLFRRKLLSKWNQAQTYHSFSSSHLFINILFNNRKRMDQETRAVRECRTLFAEDNSYRKKRFSFLLSFFFFLFPFFFKSIHTGGGTRVRLQCHIISSHLRVTKFSLYTL